jgi:hypothetical protein
MPGHLLLIEEAFLGEGFFVENRIAIANSPGMNSWAI